MAPALEQDVGAATEWVAKNRNAVEAALVTFGAVLWRGFAVHGPEDFERFLSDFTPFSQGYVGGTSHRKAVTGKVMEATRADDHINIIMHQEMAYLPTTPRLLAFYCNKPAERGGETPIADMRGLMEALPQGLQDKLKAHGVRYIRNFRNDETLNDWRADPYFNHYSWQYWFETTDRAEVEVAMIERGSNVQWNDDGSLTIWTVLPATSVHPKTGEKLFFNQIYAMRQHRVTIGEHNITRIDAAYPNYLDKPNAAAFGNGEPLSEEDFMAVHAEMERREVSFRWEQGDVMLLDNKLTAHGRHPYKGERDTQVMLFE
ncbi:TauD/TfdA family dioxygenase [Sphingobium tyrosinilyticum]|uniref:TauD/TfdA family dioxygenase n=1 Tax=Sphingobium tyrosinilyticum TaxID=2715436 RepID=A0ABV9F0T5_9SPHN